MALASADNFFDDFSGNNDDSLSSSSHFASNYHRHVRDHHHHHTDTKKFVSGDELHRLRHQVLALRLELQEARRSLQQLQDEQQQLEEEEEDIEYRHTRHYHEKRVHELEQAIMKTQQVDAEFVYTVSLQRQELAEQEGNLLEAARHFEHAMEARAALPQFNLEGLWVGKYNEDGYDLVNVTYQGDVLVAAKVTGTKNVPKGQATFQVDLSPKPFVSANAGQSQSAQQQQQSQSQQEQPHEQILSPIELGDSAARQWGCKYLQRFAGQGQVAAEDYQDSQWVDGQLIMVNEYFSFAWLPIGHQVFFGRPTPELILKLMKDEKKKEVGDCSARAFLERCWEETEHIEDDIEVNNEGAMMDSSSDCSYYYEEGCFQ
ncbi:MAG: hypothetical protein SGARI_006820 [Bacillariaceae sp.]